MEEKIIIAGFGGQGILFLGKLICQAGMEKGLHVTFFPSYGAEVRGGTANCHVILSDKRVAQPVVEKADTLIIMSEPSLLKFESLLIPKGLLIFNSSLIKINLKRDDIFIESIPASDMAYKLGDVGSANMVMLGRYIKCRGLIPFESIERNIRGPKRDINLKAISIGVEYDRQTSPGKVCA